MIIQKKILNSKSENMYGYAAPEVTTVQHTNTYAPGIATYGINGIQGYKGENGSSIFFTDILFSNNDDYKILCERISAKKSVVKWKDYTYLRAYINGDIFIDSYGNIYLLTDITNLIIDVKNNKDDDKKTLSKDYFTFLGKLPVDTSNIVCPDRLRNKKLVINNTDKNIDSEALLTLISKSDNNITNFIDMDAIYNGIPDINLSIYFNSNTNAFHINSSYPICIEAPVSVAYNNNSNIKSDEYSPILTTDNSITTYISKCKDIIVDIDSSIYSYTKTDSSTIYYGAIYTLEFKNNKSDAAYGDDNLALKFTSAISNITSNPEDITIHFQNGTFLDFQILRENVNTYRFKRDYDIISFNKAIQQVYYTELDNIQVSLIYNIESFLKIGKKEMTGVSFGTNERKQTD